MRKKYDRFMKLVLNKKKGCCEKEALIKAFLNEISVQEKFELLDHISVCPECSSYFEALREIWTKEKDILGALDRIEFTEEDTEQLKKLAKQEIRKLKSQAREEKRPIFYGKKILAAVTGAAFIIVIISIFVLLKGPREIELERKTNQWNIELIEPRGEINKSFLMFNWTPVKGVRNYTLEILDRGLETFYQAKQIKAESFRLPEEVFKRLEKGEIYFWKVVAELENNQKIESDFGKFKVSYE
ncbi:MAG: anti-sigma factor family protein [Candidatus Aminicenantia bacterium]